MRVLFVKRSLAWPRSSGHDVHTFQMLKACADLGHDIGLATITPPPPAAIAGAALSFQATLEAEPPPPQQAALPYTRLQERFRSYWGVDPAIVARLRACVDRFAPDAVVVAGLEALAYLPGVPDGIVRVWYAADEWVWHHLSLIHARDRATWHHARVALLKGVYERAYAPLIDRAWVVSTSEQRAMRWFAGVRAVDVVPNGVDANHYRPSAHPERPESAVFWGRLDFEPNIQGLEWFCDRVWPIVRQRRPEARFTIIGFQPTPAVEALAARPGIELLPNLPDLREEVGRRQVVVLPFVSGGGIKNKLLEAAAMGKPIVCTPRAAGGLRQAAEAGLAAVSAPEEWAAALDALWRDDEGRRRRGAQARDWVTTHHGWAVAARHAMDGIAASLAKRGGA